MVGSFSDGDFVDHPTFGLGKVVHSDAGKVRVYFEKKPGTTPEARTAVFSLPTQHLQPSVIRTDPHLDGLPPWNGQRFQRFETDLDIARAKQRFAHHFEKGFDDPEYVRRERGYKVEASKRYAREFAPFVTDWIASGDAGAIVTTLRRVYGDATLPQEARLNLLYAKVEQPAYFDALERGGEPLFRYMTAALAFVARDAQETFDAMVAALLALPTKRDGASLDHWTTLTWLPFIARPSEHILVKPTITQTFASLLPYDVRYRAELNYETYRRAVLMAQLLAERLQVSGLCVSGRRLDLIDVQSFMWVVMRYSEPAITSAGE